MDGPQRAAHDSVKVIVRVRPFTDDEVKASLGKPQPTVLPNSDTLVSCVSPANPTVRHTFPFDRVAWSVPPEQFGGAAVPYAGQDALFDEVGLPTVSSSFQGYNGCIFAYGQTCSGKTYTMMGWDGDEGLIPRLCREVFARIGGRGAEGPGAPRVSYSVTLSFLEIYMEGVCDLTIPKGNGAARNLSVYHDPQLGPIVKDLKCETVGGWDDVRRILQVGNRQKTIRATAMNDRSSRSHVVIQLTITQTEVVGRVGRREVSKTRRSRLNLIDLAGSEKISKSKVEGQGMQEAANINKSLTTLGRVIDALIEGGRSHVPYRDSVLTTLLSDSLGGNSRTYMVACLSPAQRNYEETLSTLRYAVRTRSVVNLVKVNEDAASALIHELQEELKLLRCGASGRPAQDPQEVDALRLQLQRTEDMVYQLQMREQEERVVVMQREAQWEVRRKGLEAQHQEQLVALEAEAEELTQSEAVLRIKTEELHTERQGLRRRAVLRRFRLAARAALQQARAGAAQDEGETIQTQATVMTSHAATVGQRVEAILNAIVEEGPRCDLCHVAPCLYLCDACSERYCNPCDAKVHRNHPTHKRYACVNGQVRQMERPCDMCLVAEGQFLCRGCGNVALCDQCDQLKHRNPKRAGHQRTMLAAAVPDSPPPTARSAVEAPAVLPLPASHPLLQAPSPARSPPPGTSVLAAEKAQNRRFSDGEQTTLPAFLASGRHLMQRTRSLPDQTPLMVFPRKVADMPQRSSAAKPATHDLMRTASETKIATPAASVTRASASDSVRRSANGSVPKGPLMGPKYQTVP
eukprot:EG_transcript_2036